MIEGKKLSFEALSSHFPILAVVIDESSKEENESILGKVSPEKIFFASSREFRTLTQLENPEGILAVIEFPDPGFASTEECPSLPPGQGLLVEDMQDPGNLGTLIRTADWFGIRQVYASQGTVDFLNPKTLRASMGSAYRVNLTYVRDWNEFLSKHSERILAADMGGTPVSTVGFDPESWLLLGNEANGLRESTRNIPGINLISIPGAGGAESLNVGVAAGILAFEMTRKGRGDTRMEANPKS